MIHVGINSRKRQSDQVYNIKSNAFKRVCANDVLCIMNIMVNNFLILLQIHLTTYGNLRWHWRICFLNKMCSNRTIPGEINATPSLHHYAYPISNVSQRYVTLASSVIHKQYLFFFLTQYRLWWKGVVSHKTNE